MKCQVVRHLDLVCTAQASALEQGGLSPGGGNGPGVRGFGSDRLGRPRADEVGEQAPGTVIGQPVRVREHAAV